VLIAVAGCSCGGGTPPPPNNGSISLAWSITDPGSHPATCEQLGSSPQIAPCLEKDEPLTTSLSLGNHLVQARSTIGATDCRQRDDILVVPPPGKSQIRTLGLMHVNVPGC
jgi:hypothetical protein